MPSFKEYKTPIVVIPKLVSLDIIDLNKRLRKRKNRIGTNLWDLLPDDVIPHIAKHKIKLDFEEKWDWGFVISKYNSNYDHKSLKYIAFNIFKDKNWDYIDYLKEKTRGLAICDDYYDGYNDKIIFEFLITNLQADINNNLNYEYLNYFKEYTKPEKILKRFHIGKTYYRTFKNTETKETIKIPFTITKRDDVKSIGLDCRGHFTAVIDDTDVDIRLAINYEIDKKKKDDNNLYLNEYTNIYLGANKKLEKYLKHNNLKIIRYRIDAK